MQISPSRPGCIAGHSLFEDGSWFKPGRLCHKGTAVIWCVCFGMTSASSCGSSHPRVAIPPPVPSYICRVQNGLFEAMCYLPNLNDNELVKLLSSVLIELPKSHGLDIAAGGRYPGLYYLLAHESPQLPGSTPASSKSPWQPRGMRRIAQKPRFCAVVSAAWHILIHSCAAMSIPCIGCGRCG